MASTVDTQPALHILALDCIQVDLNIRHQLVAAEVDHLRSQLECDCASLRRLVRVGRDSPDRWRSYSVVTFFQSRTGKLLDHIERLAARTA